MGKPRRKSHPEPKHTIDSVVQAAQSNKPTAQRIIDYCQTIPYPFLRSCTDVAAAVGTTKIAISSKWGSKPELILFRHTVPTPMLNGEGKRNQLWFGCEKSIAELKARMPDES